ncbi:MAG: DUF4129 domain-containing protein, partial [Chloroflexota bacterium]|nr:DUF4129 domain-containing protein [Chloroflexota bacterium]
VATIVEEDDSRIFTVREIYQGLLWAGARAGVPRRAPETPYEYQAKLTGRVLMAASHLRVITQAYVEERYGGVSVATEKLRALNHGWRRLRELLRGQETSG